jgi:ankyrin repeat protein
MSKAVSAIEHGNEGASQILLQDISKPTLIWTSMSDGQPKAFREALALTTDLEWLDGVPEYLPNYRGKQLGVVYSPESALESTSTRQQEWNQQYPATFDMIVRANALPSSDLMFGALADWVEGSPSCQAAAEKVWKAGGFINTLLCRRLLSSGAQLDCQFWRDQVTALHVAATFWEHDALENLLVLGADALVVSPNGYNALHWFCFAQGGPMKDKEPKMFPHRCKRIRIKSSLRRLVDSVAEKETLIHAQDTDKITPLMLSVQVSPTITRFLLQEGAVVDQIDNRNRTGLMHFFIGSEYIQRPRGILNALLLAGADARLSDSNGVTAVGYWGQQLLSQELSCLYAGFNAHNMNFRALDTCGVLAQETGMADYLKPLQIPLAAAARLGNAQLCRYVLSGGASANEHGIDGQSPMAHNSGSVAQDLEEMSWNPLMIAIFAKAYMTALLLLEDGADVNFKISKQKLQSYNISKAGTTPLHLVVANDGRTVRISEMYMATGGPSAGCSFEAAGRPDQPVSRKSLWERMAEMTRPHLGSEDLGCEDSDVS